MSILDKCNARTEDLHYRRHEDPHEAHATFMQCEDQSGPEFNGFTYENAFRTEVRFTTVWYANQAQFHGREQLARKELLHFMYGPVLKNLVRLRARVADRDWHAVMQVVDDIEKELVE